MTPRCLKTAKTVRLLFSVENETVEDGGVGGGGDIDGGVEIVRSFSLTEGEECD